MVPDEPDYLELFPGHTVANLLSCPECCGDGEIDILISGHRKVPVFDKETCPTCKGDGLVFPSEITEPENL